MVTNELTRKIIGAAVEVHRALGPGLLESTYERCLAHELDSIGLACTSQWPLPVRYKGIQLDCGYRVDILVEDRVVVELKTVESVLPVHEAQILSYMKLGGFEVGLLINFYVPILTKGIKRFKL